MTNHRMLLALTLVWLAGLAVSGWQPFDRATWVMEVAPALIALPLLILFWQLFMSADAAFERAVAAELGFEFGHGIVFSTRGIFAFG